MLLYASKAGMSRKACARHLFFLRVFLTFRWNLLPWDCFAQTTCRSLLQHCPCKIWKFLRSPWKILMESGYTNSSRMRRGFFYHIPQGSCCKLLMIKMQVDIFCLIVVLKTIGISGENSTKIIYIRCILYQINFPYTVVAVANVVAGKSLTVETKGRFPLCEFYRVNPYFFVSIE